MNLNRLFIKSKYKTALELNEENRVSIQNTVFYESLEFGKKWMQPIENIVSHNFPKLNSSDANKLKSLILSTREEIFKTIYEIYCSQADLEHIDYDSIKSGLHKYIRNKYSWLNKKNTDRVISQGFYYAWKR